ncbi:MAG: DsbA family protein [Granulosicoccaceae bacterium]
MASLYYIHDPMCSWCWGFKPVLAELVTELPREIEYKRLLGGLAADSDEPMSEDMQQMLQTTWQRIEERIPGTRFNFAFWTECQPRRSTYPACRAVIAARQQGEQFDVQMTEAIQRAYYTQARNPSDSDTLVELAAELGLDVPTFEDALISDAVERQLRTEIAEAAELGVEGLPALVLVDGQSRWPIPVDYNDAATMLELIEALRAG